LLVGEFNIRHCFLLFIIRDILWRLWYTENEIKEGEVPRMAGKKKAGPTKVRTLAGEPIFSSALAPAEERAFKETTAHYRDVALRMKEDFDTFSGAVATARTGEQAAKASVSFFCKYFEGKYQRLDVVEALATAATLPAPSANHLGTSPCFMLGAALWLLDHIKSHELEEQFYPLLPDILDDEIDLVVPTVDDLNHTRDEMLGLMSVFMNRKGPSRQAFRKVWGLVDKETAGRIKAEFRDAVLDYFDRFLEVSTRVNPSTAHGPEGAPPLLAAPSMSGDFSMEIGPEPFEDISPAKDEPGLWFLTNTALLIGTSPERIRETLYYRRSSNLLEGFRMKDPYSICAAFLLLERDGDVLVDLNMLTAAVVICAERHLPWGTDEAFAYAAPFEKGAPDHSLRYPF